MALSRAPIPINAADIRLNLYPLGVNQSFCFHNGLKFEILGGKSGGQLAVLYFSAIGQIINPITKSVIENIRMMIICAASVYIIL